MSGTMLIRKEMSGSSYGVMVDAFSTDVFLNRKYFSADLFPSSNDTAVLGIIRDFLATEVFWELCTLEEATHFLKPLHVGIQYLPHFHIAIRYRRYCSHRNSL